MINKVTLLGNVGAHPEIRSTATGRRVGNLSLATHERVRSDGEWTEHTEWHRLVVWGRLADIVEQYVSTGRQLYIEGVLRTRSWEGAEGGKRYSTEVHVRELKLLGGRGERAETRSESEELEEVPF
jgi:single-strand DNA-binding protein